MRPRSSPPPQPRQRCVHWRLSAGDTNAPQAGQQRRPALSSRRGVCCCRTPGRGRPASSRPPSFQGPGSARHRTRRRGAPGPGRPQESPRTGCGSRCLAQYPQTRGRQGRELIRCHRRQRNQTAARTSRLKGSQNVQRRRLRIRPYARQRPGRVAEAGSPRSTGRRDAAAHGRWPHGGVLRVRLRVQVPFSRRHPC